MTDLEKELLEALIKIRPILRIPTIRQVIEAGDEAIEAAGLNEWCINEGLADGHETLDFWWIDSLINKAKGV